MFVQRSIQPPANAMVKMTEVARSQMRVQAAWADPRGLEVVFADELQIQDVGDRCYLTFGQVRLPSVNAPDDEDAGIIQPVVRLVLTRATVLKMLGALSQVKDAIGNAKPEAKEP